MRVNEKRRGREQEIMKGRTEEKEETKQKTGREKE